MQPESITGGNPMAVTAEQRSELAYRSTNGIEVSLFWSKPTDRVTIELIDSRIDQRLEFEVAPAKALDAFRHPYVYAPTRALGVAVDTEAAVQR
jgi:hypothetical protein